MTLGTEAIKEIRRQISEFTKEKKSPVFVLCDEYTYADISKNCQSELLDTRDEKLFLRVEDGAAVTPTYVNVFRITVKLHYPDYFRFVHVVCEKDLQWFKHMRGIKEERIDNGRDKG